MIKLAERNCGMNYEIAAFFKFKADEVFESAMKTLEPMGVKEVKVEVEVREENDGGPYGSLNNAPHFYMVVYASGTIPDGLKEGCQEMIDAIEL